MSLGSALRDAGLRDSDINIDGVALQMPAMIDVRNQPNYTAWVALNGANTIFVPYRGDGLIDQPDWPFEWSIEYELSDLTTKERDILEFLEGLRTSGSIHTFTYWKKYRYTYTLRSGQQVLYLPRPDAYSKSYAGKTSTDYMAVIKRTPAGGTTSTVTVVYKASVVAGDAVTAGEVWISNAASVHPESGKNVALFKLGTAPTGVEVLTVDYYPLFNVFATAVPTKAFDKVGREDKTLYLIETN